MATFEIALAKTLAAEGGFFHNEQTGEVVNRGITLATYRDLVDSSATEDTIRNLTPEQTASFYLRFFWQPLHVDSVQDQDVANKFFDIAVNQGIGSAVRIMQEAVNSLGHSVTVDGRMGPLTQVAISMCSAPTLLAKFREIAEQRYRNIAKANPLLAKNLPGWLQRLES